MGLPMCPELAPSRARSLADTLFFHFFLTDSHETGSHILKTSSQDWLTPWRTPRPRPGRSTARRLIWPTGAVFPRHSVVDLASEVVGRRDDGGAGLERQVGFPIGPLVPQPGDFEPLGR